MTELTIETIKAGLVKNDSWVFRAVVALGDSGLKNVIARHKFLEFRDEYLTFARLEDMEDARQLCLNHASDLLEIATSPAFDFRSKTFVLTGKLDKFTRNALTSKLESLGAYVSSSVSRATDVVIVGSKPGAKFRRAESLGIPRWNESDLLDNLKPKSQQS